METPKVNWEINISAVINTLIILGSLLIAYGQFSNKFEQYAITLETTQRQTNRIEKYLSSQDKDYWLKVQQYGDK